MADFPSIIMSNSSVESKNENVGIQTTALNIDKEGFSRLYDLYVKTIYRFVYFKVNSREEAEDLTSETFLKAWDYISKPENSNKIRNIKAFLYQIASNLVIDFYRKKALLPLSLNSMVESMDVRDDRSLSHIDKFEKDVEVSELKKAFKNIPENYCDVIIWYYLEEFKISEISQILEKSEGTVRVLIHRALKSLKRELERIEKEKKQLIEGRENLQVNASA